MSKEIKTGIDFDVTIGCVHDEWTTVYTLLWQIANIDEASMTLVRAAISTLDDMGPNITVLKEAYEKGRIVVAEDAAS